MATGDIKNNLRKLQSELKKINYPNDVDFEKLSKGVVEAFLPILHHAFSNYSLPLAEKISDMGIEMFGKTDLRFIEAMYKVLRELFTYKPPLSRDQFFSFGFAERKIIMCTDILGLLTKWHQYNARKGTKGKSTVGKSAAKLGPRAVSSSTRPHEWNGAPAAGSKSSGNVVPKVVNQVLVPAVAVIKPSNDVDPQPRPKTPPCGAGITHSSSSSQPSTVQVNPTVNLNKKVTFQVSSPEMMLPESLPNTITERGNTCMVEVVSMGNSFTSHVNENLEDDLHLRPIDILATTPARPNTSKGMVVEELVEQMVHLHNAVKNWNNTMEDIQQRLSNVELAVKLKDENMQSQQTMSSGASPAMMEGILARLTLLENKCAIIESKIPKSNTSPLTSTSALAKTSTLALTSTSAMTRTLPSTSVWTRTSALASTSTLASTSALASAPALASTLAMANTSGMTTSSSNVCGRPALTTHLTDSSVKSNSVTTSTSSGQAMPSPILPIPCVSTSLLQTAVPAGSIMEATSFSSQTLNQAICASGSPVEVNLTSTPKEGETVLDQAERIKMLMKNTENLLGIQVSSPLGANKAREMSA